MSVPQISVFVESQPGRLHRVLELFEAAQVNVRGFSAADTGDYGIVRFVVDDAEAGIAALQDAGAAAVLSEVLCLKLDDAPGELARIMGVLADCNINVSYCYSLISTYIALSVGEADVAEVERMLADQPVEFISVEDLKRTL